MTIALDRDAVLHHLHAVVDEFGKNYRYPGAPDGECVYVKDGQPSCIVGHVLHRAGVPIDTLKEFDAASEGLSQTIRGLHKDGHLSRAGIEIDDPALYALSHAQSCQDEGQTWGSAVAGVAF